jgi:Fe-S oxidoreductase
MFLPQKRLLFHPRNKNITLGALIEAIYYSQLLTGEPDPELLEHLRKIMEHCTACGKCTYVCPVKINNAQVALESRSFLDSKNASGHPLKKKILHFLSQDPQHLLPKAAKAASIGQQIQNKVVGFIPASWRQKLDNPLFRGKGPTTEYKNLAEALHLEQGSVFVPDQTRVTQAVIYFPGCGAGLFYRSIGLSALYLLLKSNTAVILPPVHLCCGYPLLASGCTESYHKIAEENKKILQEMVLKTYSRGIVPSHILTSCGTCREGIKEYDLSSPSSSLVQMDVVQYLLQNLSIKPENSPQTLIYHPSCHAEWSGTNLAKAGQIYALNLGEFLNSQVRINPGCCGESGMGALTSPEIYNRIRDQKIERLREVLPSYSQKLPILVGCPSCKIGIKRSLMELKDKHRVLHTVEFLAEQVGGPKWKTEFLKALKKGKVKDNQRVIKL